MATPKGPIALKRKNILVVEDDYNTRYMLSLLLKGEGYEVLTAVDGVDALSILTRNNFDLIITDINMPRMNGVELISKVRLRRKVSRPRIIAMSDYDWELLDASEAGASFCVVKPLSAKPLIDIIHILTGYSSDSTEEKIDEKPDTGLVEPVRNTIVLINNDLLSIFKNDPDGIRKLDPFRFEELVADLFQNEGYEVVVTPPRADGGKDIYVYRKDPITNLVFLVECKRYVPPNTVGVEIARQLYGIVQQERANGGIIVTTSYFTKPAKEFAATVPYQLFLKDYDYLIEWLKKVKLVC